MKIHFDKKLLKYSIYVTLTAIAIYLALTIMSNIGKIFTTTFNIIGAGLGLIKPLLIAIVIAYLLYPLTKFIENFLRTNTLYKIKNHSTRRVIAIVLAYLLIIGAFIPSPGASGGIEYGFIKFYSHFLPKVILNPVWLSIVTGHLSSSKFSFLNNFVSFL